MSVCGQLWLLLGETLIMKPSQPSSLLEIFSAVKIENFICNILIFLFRTLIVGTR